MCDLARCMCGPPLLTDLRRAVLNPTDQYSVSIVNKSGYRDKTRSVVWGHLAPYGTELPTDEGAAEMNKVHRSIQYVVSEPEASRNRQDKRQIDTRAPCLALTVPATKMGGSK
jgi:hypothetical protein